MSTPRTYGYSPAHGWETDQSKVLRNTYLLLALTMIPTVLGAYLGKLMLPVFLPILKSSPTITALVLFGISWFLISLTDRFSDSGMGIPLLGLFTAFSGFSVSPILSMLMSSYHGTYLVMLAAGITGGIFLTMAILANFIKADAQKWFGFLMIGFWVVLAVKLISLFFVNSTPLMQAGCAMSIILFSAWIFFDIRNIIQGAQGNYIRATLGIYLNLFNLFMNVLQLLMSFMGMGRKD